MKEPIADWKSHCITAVPVRGSDSLRNVSALWLCMGWSSLINKLFKHYLSIKPGTHQAVFVRRPTKFSQCVPRRRLKLVLVCFFSADSTCWIGVGARRSVGHLIILIGCSAGEPVHKKGVERTCYLAVGCWASAWCVRATLNPDAADVSWPCSLLSSPLVSRCQLGVHRA